MFENRGGWNVSTRAPVKGATANAVSVNVIIRFQLALP